MPETITAEPESTAAPATTDAPPTPPEPAPPEGDAPVVAEGDAGTEATPALDYSAVEDELEAEVERRVSERAAKAEADAEERATVRTREADTGEASRHALYATAEREMGNAARTLHQLALDGEGIDPKTLRQHMDAVMAGVASTVARDTETAVKALQDVALPDLTPAEAKALEPVMYEFRRNGKVDGLLPKVLELALARKDTEIADLRKQLGNRKAVTEAAEKLAKVREAAGPDAGAAAPKGKTTTSGDPAKLAQRIAYGRDADGNAVTQADRDEFAKRYPG